LIAKVVLLVGDENDEFDHAQSQLMPYWIFLFFFDKARNSIRFRNIEMKRFGIPTFLL